LTARRTASWVRGGGCAAARAARAAWHARRLKALFFCITEHLHVKPGKGAAFVRTKLKNQVSGASRSGATVHTARVHTVRLVALSANELAPEAPTRLRDAQATRLKRPSAPARRCGRARASGTREQRSALSGASAFLRQVESADMNKSVNQFTYTEGDQYAPTVVQSAGEPLIRLPRQLMR
jgi:hypothetical protein